MGPEISPALTYCKLAVTDPAAYRRLGPALPQWLPEVIQNDGFVQLVSVQLFSGGTEDKTEEQRAALKFILNDRSEVRNLKAREAALALTEIRGLKHCLARRATLSM